MLGIWLVGFTVRVAIAIRNTGLVSTVVLDLISQPSVNNLQDGRRRLVGGTLGSRSQQQRSLFD